MREVCSCCKITLLDIPGIEHLHDSSFKMHLCTHALAKYLNLEILNSKPR